MFIKSSLIKVACAAALPLISLAGQGSVRAQERVRQTGPPRSVVRLKTTVEVGGAETFAPGPDNKLVALSRKDKTVQIWDVAGVKVQSTLAGFKKPPSIHWSPDGRRLLTTNWGKSAVVWDPQTGEKLYELNGLRDDMSGLEWSPDAKMVLIVAGKTVRVWDAQSGMSLYELSGLRHDVLLVKWSPDRRTIMTMTVDDSWKAIMLTMEKTEAQLWDAGTGRLKFTLKMKGPCGNAKFSRDGSLILTMSDKEDARLWDAETGQLKATLRPKRRSIDEGAFAMFSPDGRVVAVQSYGRGIYLWEAATGELRATVIEQNFDNNDFAHGLRGFSPDGKLLVVYRERFKSLKSFSVISSVQLHDSLTGELRAELTGRNMRDSAHQLLWGQDGRTLVMAGGSHKYEGKIWDAATGQRKTTFPMVAKRGSELFDGSYWKDLDCLSFHPTLPVLIATSNNFIRFWDPANGELLQTLEGVGSGQWSADGQKLVVLTKDRKSVQVWEAVQE